MVNRRRIALAAITMFSFLPVAAHGGAGGSPTAPGAGKSTDYCCQIVERPTQQGGTDETQTTQPTGKPITSVNGTGCQAIAEDDFSRNACVGTVVKCRGEFFTPSTGTVQRCLTP